MLVLRHFVRPDFKNDERNASLQCVGSQGNLLNLPDADKSIACVLATDWRS